MTKRRRYTILSHLIFKWWSLNALWGRGSTPLHNYTIYFEEKNRSTKRYLCMNLKKMVYCWRQSRTRAVEPKDAATISKKGGVNGGVPSGRSAAQSQGTVRAEYCGSVNRPSFEHFSFILGPVMLTTVETMKYERTKLTHPSGSGAAVSANQVRAPNGSSQVVQN